MKLNQIYENYELYECEEDKERQLELDRYLQYYLGCQNALKLYSWDDSPLMSGLDRIQSEQYGIKWNKPITKPPRQSKKPYHESQLAHAIVTRLTALLFGNGKQPDIEIDNEIAEEKIEEFIKKTNFWSKLSLARNYGGAQGSVVIGLQLINNEIKLDIEDAQYCLPIFDNNDRLIQLTFKANPYDFVIYDEIYKYNIWTDDVDKPIDDKTEFNIDVSKHGFSKIPYFWIKNEQIIRSIDGLSDYNGQLENINAIDRIYSECIIGVEQNCDPSMVMKFQDADAMKKANGIETGAGTVIKMMAGDDLSLLELQGSGAIAGMQLAETIKENIMQSCRVILDEGKASGKTATELQIRETALKEHVDELRRQYGPAIEYIIELYLDFINMPYDIEIEWPKEGVNVIEQKTKVETFKLYLESLITLMDKGILTDMEFKEKLSKFEL